MLQIGPDHFLAGVKRELLPGGNAMPVRRVLVIHFTAGMSAASSIAWWRNPGSKGANAHLVIDRDGSVIQCRGFDRTCGHAGVSRWRDPKTGVLYKGANAYSIGIELANAGDSVSGSVEEPKLFKKYPAIAGAVRAKHKNGGPLTLWERYPEAQRQSCFAAARAIVTRYKLDDVVGHEDIAPERKTDPGPAFPMAELRAACGFSGLPGVHRA